jgi:hypothetical protein
MKETKESTQKYQDIPFPWIGIINIVKISMLPKVLCRSNTVPIKVLMFFSEIEKRNFSKISIQNYPNPNSINWKKK